MSYLSRGFPEHHGIDYLTCLAEVHRTLRPEIYFEIGTSSGSTLKLASRRSIAVDPMFQIQGDVLGDKSALHLFQQSSDDFFRDRHLDHIIKKPISVAFLDGLHLSEFLLRDFINTEFYCDEKSIILIHDCLPLDAAMSTRNANDLAAREASVQPTWWTGDVWKIVPLLNKYRPDLVIECYDAPPTGLVVVRNLARSSKVLSDSYNEILKNLADPSNDAAMLESTVLETPVMGTRELFSFLDRVSG